MTYRFTQSSRLHNAVPKEKCCKTIGDQTTRYFRILVQRLAIEPGLFQEREAADEREAQQADRPPELHREECAGRDETGESRACNRAEQEGHVECREGPPTLVQEEQVGDDARAQDRRHRTKKAGEQSRHHIRDIIIRMSHDSTPDLADQREQDTPENDRAAAQNVSDGRKKNGPAAMPARAAEFCLVSETYFRRYGS